MDSTCTCSRPRKKTPYKQAFVGRPVLVPVKKKWKEPVLDFLCHCSVGESSIVQVFLAPIKVYSHGGFFASSEALQPFFDFHKTSFHGSFFCFIAPLAVKHCEAVFGSYEKLSSGWLPLSNCSLASLFMEAFLVALLRWW